MVPSKGDGKKFIKEVARLINLWTNDSPLKSIALKVIHVMPALLLQKQMKNSKAKEHVAALERRLELWENGYTIELLSEGESIQEMLLTGERPKNIAKISVKFKELMQKCNVNGALKLLTNQMSNGILPLTEQTLSQLEIKHPYNRDASADVHLNGPITKIHSSVFDANYEEILLRAASTTNGGSGLSGLHSDGWRQVLTANSSGTDLLKSVADFIKQFCSKKINSENKSLEALIACTLIPLNKNPGLRPIGVGEVLRRIAGKVLMKILKKDTMHADGSLQVCAGQENRAEATIRAMYDIYNNEHSEAVLLVDAKNAFNSINRNVIIHNIFVVCPAISAYV